MPSMQCRTAPECRVICTRDISRGATRLGVFVDLHPRGPVVGVEEDLELARDTSRSPSPEIRKRPCGGADEGDVHRKRTWTGGAPAADLATIPSGRATASSNPGAGRAPSASPTSWHRRSPRAPMLATSMPTRNLTGLRRTSHRSALPHYAHSSGSRAERSHPGLRLSSGITTASFPPANGVSQ